MGDYSSPPTQYKFASSEFLEDIKKTAAAIGAPFDETTTGKVLDIFGEQFNEGGVILRTSNQPRAKLDYRFFMRRQTDIMGLALKEGLIEAGDPMSDLINSWTSLYNGIPEASADFDAVKGLAKVWLYFGAIRPVDQILAAPGVPEGIRAHLSTFQSLGLQEVQHTAVDYHKRSVNIYLSYYGKTTAERAAAITKLAGSPPPSDAQLKEMQQYLPHDGYPVSITMKLDGTISRVCFYALHSLPPDSHKVDPTITAFWSAAPCHDESDFKSLGWSFGGVPYLKTERGYSGNVESFGKYWGVFPEDLETAA